MPKITAPVNLELREHGNPVMSCEIECFRYHVWLVSVEGGVPVLAKDRIVYKNPITQPVGARSKTIKLHRDYGQGKPIAEHMLSQVPMLFEAAKAELAAKIAAEAIEHRRLVLLARKGKHVEDLYNALVAFVENKDANAAVVEATALIEEINRSNDHA